MALARDVHDVGLADMVSDHVDHTHLVNHTLWCIIAGRVPMQESGPLSLWDEKSEAAYSKKPNFTCIAASGATNGASNGHVVVGSADGTIRLFNSSSLKPVCSTVQPDV